MAKRIVILGRSEPGADVNVLRAVLRFVADTQPDELVCIERSVPLLERLREVYEGPVGLHANNLEDRFGATALPEFYKVAPGWITTDDRQGQISLSRIAGNTALNAAKKFGVSVVMGNTHRAGIGSHTEGYGGEIRRTLTGMEVGNLMDRKITRADNGQQAFGLLTVDGQRVKPELVPIHKGQFTVDGRVWEI